MNLNSQNMKLKGDLSIRKYNADNRLIQELKVPNLVVTSGKQHVASRMAGYTGSSASVMSHMGIGSNGAPPDAANNSLTAQTARVAFPAGVPTVSGATITYSATFGPGVGTGPVVEAGIFNASTGGTMMCRTIFPSITKDDAETIVITWNVTVG